MLPALILACASPEPDVLLVTLDTTRADALGVYGRAPSPTPNIDALAMEGRVFEEAQTVTPLTLPAHASILTGLLPERHGLRRNGAGRLPDAIETVAERLRGAGWQTGAFVSAVVLDRAFGLAQGFDAYEGDFAAADGPVVPSHDADVATDGFARWLLGVRRDAPWFAWVHYYDPHLPYAAHGDGIADPYLAEVAFMDDRIGRLLAAARAMGRDRPLAIVLVGDHGEGRGEHDEETHGWFVYRSTTRVPLVVVAPGVAAGRVDAPVSVVDVAPTLLAIAGVEGGELDGRSLLGEPRGVVTGETFTPRSALGFAELRFVQDARWRYILAPRPELYDWRADPGETRDLGADHPAAAALRAKLGDGVAARAGTVGDALGAQLQALGYTTGPAAVGDAVPFHQLPDPKDEPSALATVDRVISQARSVPPAEGVPLLEAVIARYPHASAARVALSRGYELLGRLDEAYAVVAPPGNEADPVARARRAQVRLIQGRAAEAAQLAEGVDGLLAATVRAEAARRRGDAGSAVRLALEGLETGWSPALGLVAGAALVDAGEPGRAVPYLERSLAEAPEDPEVRLVLAIALAEGGDLSRAAALLHEQRARTGPRADVDVALGKVEGAAGDLAGGCARMAPYVGQAAYDAVATRVCAEAALGGR